MPAIQFDKEQQLLLPKETGYKATIISSLIPLISSEEDKVLSDKGEIHEQWFSLGSKVKVPTVPCSQLFLLFLETSQCWCVPWLRVGTLLSCLHSLPYFLGHPLVTSSKSMASDTGTSNMLVPPRFASLTLTFYPEFQTDVSNYQFHVSLEYQAPKIQPTAN